MGSWGLTGDCSKTHQCYDCWLLLRNRTQTTKQQCLDKVASWLELALMTCLLCAWRGYCTDQVQGWLATCSPCCLCPLYCEHNHLVWKMQEASFPDAADPAAELHAFPPFFKKINHRIKQKQRNTRKQSRGRRNMFCACEILPEDPCPGGW